MQPDFLSAAELEKLAGMRFEKRRREWLLGRWTAKQLLQASDPSCAVLPTHLIEIQNDPAGAPHASLPGLRPVVGCLSISHREDAAACAYCADPALRIGIDLERVEPRSSAFIEDFLTTNEAATANALEDTARDHWAVLCWSSKEALLKALGIGLRADTRSIELLSAGTVQENGWGPLGMRTSLAGAESVQGWWREWQDNIITLAVLSGPSQVIHLKDTSQG